MRLQLPSGLLCARKLNSQTISGKKYFARVGRVRQELAGGVKPLNPTTEAEATSILPS